MTQLGMGVAALNHDSKFAAAYEKGIKKTEYWTYALQDSLDLIARLPALAARIYRNVYHPGKEIPAIDKEQDLVGKKFFINMYSPLADDGPLGNYTNMLGYGGNEGMKEYLRLYITLHGDHEGLYRV
jgi:citrate synthase